MVTMIATNAASLGMDDVGNTILNVKSSNPYDVTVKKLSLCTAPALSRTYAYLMCMEQEEKEEEVKELTKGWNKSGLAAMVYYRLTQLMPVWCTKCNKVHRTERTEVPTVTCRMCGTGACMECYTSEGRDSRWLHLCRTCLEEVDGLRGEEALTSSQINKTTRKTSKEKAKEHVEPEVTVIERVEEAGNTEEKEEEVEAYRKMCTICDEAFNTKRNFRRHMATVHEEEEEGDGEWETDNRKRGFQKEKHVAKRNGKAETKDNVKEKKDIVCRHFKKARCNHGMSGKQSHDGVPRCPYKHPSICSKLLRHGDRGRGGCRGREAGCKEFHQVKTR